MNELNGFKIEKFNQYNLSEGKKTSTCPICSQDRKKKTDKCLMINWEIGIATCQHCGEVLQIHTYKKKTENKAYKKPEFKNSTELPDKVVKWFNGRKITQNTLRSLKVSSGIEWMPQTKKEESTIQFNYFRDNELINVKYRDGRKNFKMYKDAEKIPYNYDNCRISNEIIICEGEIDALSFFEAGFYNVCSTPNGSTLKNVNLEWLDNSYEIFENKEKVYLSLDNDEPGQNVQKELIRRLGAHRCYIIDLEGCKDANEFICKYGLERLRRCYDNAELTPIENITSYYNHEEALIDYYKNGDQKGFQIGLSNFDEVFSTYRKQYIVVTGIPSHGKSNFVDQMCLGYALNYDWKGAYCSVENDPKHIHIDSLCRKLLGYRPTSHAELKTDKWRMAADFIEESISMVEFSDGYDLKKVLNKVKELVLRKGIKYFVLDPYNKIKLKESKNKNINDYTSDYLLEIDTFCRQHDLLCILVAHPVKMHKVNGITPEPDFYSIKGGGEFYDMSPHGLLVWRDFNRDIVKVKILKCKFQNLGINGAEVYFKWNTVNSRYTPITNEIDMNTISFEYEFDYSNWLVQEDQQKNISYNTGIEPNQSFFEEVDEIPF